ncbi:mitochondrial inner membrane protein COX18-like isoform X2 [Acanthaster planci]|uniref:Mitochondrial inner membrane protein COX18-like isoform X2 n=1 Tax=Acanthaster planci TaxID=133434 RepID=A0A8B7ZNE8_ACAPL|nr:mitochondrial inner membrane protein COX18-like isoform X2 [Acanthaster planci]
MFMQRAMGLHLIVRHTKGLSSWIQHLTPSRRIVRCQKVHMDIKFLPPTELVLNDAESLKYQTKQHLCTGNSAQQRQFPLTASSDVTPRSCSLPLQTVTSGKGFLHRLVPSDHVHSRHYSSTQPTTAYELLLTSRPVQLSQALLEHCHDLTGLPWWASLVLSTFLLRATLTFPLGIYSQYIRAKVERLQPDIVAMAKHAFVRRFAERARLEGWSEKRAEKAVMGLVKHYSKELFIRDNCHPAKGSILFLVQFPLWLCLSLALRNMSGAFAGNIYQDPASVVPSLSTEGTLWFTDLTMADPIYILPVLVGLFNLCNIEIMALHNNPVSQRQRYITNLLRGLSLVMIPIAAQVPTAMTLYWASSAFYGLGQNILLKSPIVRSALNIPFAPSDSETPYRDMANIVGTRYLWRKGTSVLGKTGQDATENVKRETGRSCTKVQQMYSLYSAQCD